MMIGKWNRTVILTYVGIFFSIIGMGFVIHADAESAMSCLILAGICDLFDGQIARRIKRTEEEKLFGIELDSVADVVNFIAFPVVLLYVTVSSWLLVSLAGTFFAICGTARLTFFNMGAKESMGEISFYRGLPVTYTALILPLVYLLKYAISLNVFDIIFMVCYLSIGVFQITDIRVSKPKRWAYPFFVVLAVGMLYVYRWIS
ncbi:CDP-alcohol phosphatidyltransferase family protein [Filifactor alocis]|uniref:CDP-alcohol phosphatidyltransferase family protein n=1 Tax=Filifactor alocis TaxID=143361 RepID=UPI003FA15BF2